MTAPPDARDRELLAAMQNDLETVLEEFRVITRNRGLAYATDRRVRDLHRAKHAIRARVRGGRTYDVVWSWKDDTGFVGSCSCPVGLHCKHLYAVAVMALSDPFVLGSDGVEEDELEDLKAEEEVAHRGRTENPRASSRTRRRAIDSSAEAFRQLRAEPEPWLREAALGTLLSYDPMARLRFSAGRPLADALAEEDPDVRCWKLVRVIDSVRGIVCPTLLAPFRDRPDLEVQAFDASRWRVLSRLAAWSTAEAALERAPAKQLRVIFHLVRERDEVLVRAEARLTSQKLQSVPRRLEQLEQLLGECRSRSGVLAPPELALLLRLVQLRTGGIDGVPISRQPAALRRLVESLHDSPLATWDTSQGPELAAQKGVVDGAPVRLGPALASVVPACEDRDGGPVLGLRILLSDGREAGLEGAVLCPPASSSERRGEGLVLLEGAFWPVVGEPPADLLAELSVRGSIPLDLERDAPLLRPLAQRFRSVARGLAARTRNLRVEPIVLADLRDEDWVQLRLLAHDAGPDWDPAAPFPEGARAFEHVPRLGFVPIDLARETRARDAAPRQESAAPRALETRGWLEVPEAGDVEPAVAWLSSVVAGDARPVPERFRSLPGHWLPATGALLERLASVNGGAARQIRIYATPELRRLFDSNRRSAPRVRVAGSGIDFFEISAEWEEASQPFSSAEIAALRAATTRFVRLPRGWVSRAWSDGQDAVLGALADLGVEPGTPPERIGITQLAGASDASLEVLAACGMSADSREAVEALRGRIARFNGIPRVDVPTGLSAELRPYQQEGLDFLAHASSLGLGAVLADDMGLGKTVQALAWLLHLRAEEPDAGPSLVVCPTSLLRNWEREAERFAPGLRVAVLERGAERHAFRAGAKKYDLLLTNYALLRRDIEDWEKLDLQAAILDEAQNVKNPEAAVSRAVRRLRSRHRLVLTGTPLENRPLDLWSLLAFVNPGLLGSQRAFVARYEGAAATPVSRARLAAKLRPILIRRLKGEVAKDLPERIEERRDCELSTEQRKLYLAELRRTRSLALAPEGSGREEAKRRIAVLAALTRLRQICCHAALAGGKRSVPSGKVEALFEILEPLLAEGHKVLIFSQFVRCLEILREELGSRHIAHHILTGESLERDRIVANFESSEGASVFLISLKAGGTGLNLTAASYVVLFDPWWNPAVEAQAIDRAHRIGQDRTVVAYRLIARGTVEERIFELQQQKAAMVRDVLGEEGFARSLSREDFAYLLEEE